MRPLSRSTDAIISVDRRGNIFDLNHIAETLSGYSREELIGQVVDVLLPEDLRAVHTKHREAFVDRPSIRRMGTAFDLVLRRKDGEEIPVDIMLSPIGMLGESGVTCIVRDVSVNREREIQLRQQAQHQAALARLGQRALSPGPLEVLFDDAVAILATALDVKYCKVLKRLPDREALLLVSGVGWRDGFVGRATVGTDRRSQAGYTLLSDEPVVVADLSTEARFTGPPLLTEHGVVSGMSVVIGGMERPWGVLGAHTVHRRDFSKEEIQFLQAVANLLGMAIERECAEEALSERKKVEERSTVAQWVLAGVADGVIVVDHRGDIQSFNPAAESIFGYSLDEVAGRNVGILVPELPRSEHDRFVANFMETGQEETLGIGREAQGQRKGGDTFPMDLRVSELHLDGAVMFAAVVRDTTERNQLMSRVIQAQKLDSVGQLVGGIAHDFNNQLGMMLLGVDAILAGQTNDSETPPGLRNDLLDIRKGLLHSSELTRKLLLFSQNVPGKMEPLSINDQIESTEKMLSRLLGEHIRSVVDLKEDLWNVSGDAASIDQIVTNLAINSRDAMPDGGVLAIETRNVHLDPKVGQANPRARPGRFVRITVKDTGCGLDEVIRARMYDPFFTTKNPDQNTGLGLSVVYGAVKAHGGWIDVESAPGRGARFDVYLPALDDKAVGHSAAGLSLRSPEGGSESILLLEDEPRLCNRIQKVLEGKGYTVVAYGDLATARLAVSETPFDLILCDLRLPDGKGTELVAEALERDGSMGTILMSGYVPTRGDAELAKLTKTSFLPKPFSASELLREVRTQLDGRG